MGTSILTDGRCELTSNSGLVQAQLDRLNVRLANKTPTMTCHRKGPVTKWPLWQIHGRQVNMEASLLELFVQAMLLSSKKWAAQKERFRNSGSKREAPKSNGCGLKPFWYRCGVGAQPISEPILVRIGGSTIWILTHGQIDFSKGRGSWGST